MGANTFILTMQQIENVNIYTNKNKNKTNITVL